jgi:hypothetical protein
MNLQAWFQALEHLEKMRWGFKLEMICEDGVGHGRKQEKIWQIGIG